LELNNAALPHRSRNRPRSAHFHDEDDRRQESLLAPGIVG